VFKEVSIKIQTCSDTKNRPLTTPSRPPFRSLLPKRKRLKTFARTTPGPAPSSNHKRIKISTNVTKTLFPVPFSTLLVRIPPPASNWEASPKVLKPFLARFKESTIRVAVMAALMLLQLIRARKMRNKRLTAIPMQRLH